MKGATCDVATIEIKISIAEKEKCFQERPESFLGGISEINPSHSGHSGLFLERPKSPWGSKIGLRNLAGDPRSDGEGFGRSVLFVFRHTSQPFFSAEVNLPSSNF